MKKFLTRKAKRKTPQHHKRLMFRWGCVGERNSVTYKGKKKKVWFSRYGSS